MNAPCPPLEFIDIIALEKLQGRRYITLLIYYEILKEILNRARET